MNKQQKDLAASADHSDIDFQIAENTNVEVARPPVESDSGDYDEEEGEEDEEEEFSDANDGTNAAAAADPLERKLAEQKKQQ